MIFEWWDGLVCDRVNCCISRTKLALDAESDHRH